MGNSRLALSSLIVFLVHGGSGSSASTKMQLLPSTLASVAVAAGPVEMVQDN